MDCCNSGTDDLKQYLLPLKRKNSCRNHTSSAAVFETCSSLSSNLYSSLMDTQNCNVDSQKIHELVIDYLICCGYKEAAEQLCADAQINFPIAAETLEQRNNIRTTIVNGDLESAIQQIEEVAPTLLQKNSKLHFKLLQQLLVELIRKKDIDKVLTFAQDCLIDKCDQPPDLFTKLEQTYALLAFDNPEQSPFGKLMGLDQRNMLANEVNSSILESLKKNPTSKLELLFRSLVWDKIQLLSKGETLSPSYNNQDNTNKVARELFALDEPVSDML